MLRNRWLVKIQGRCHYAALKWNGLTQVVPYIDFDVAKLVLTESVKHQVRSEDVCLSILMLWVRITLAICEPTYTSSLMLQCTYRFSKEYLEMVLHTLAWLCLAMV